MNLYIYDRLSALLTSNSQDHIRAKTASLSNSVELILNACETVLHFALSKYFTFLSLKRLRVFGWVFQLASFQGKVQEERGQMVRLLR